MSTRVSVVKHAELVIANLDGVFHDARSVMCQSMVDLMHRFGMVADPRDDEVRDVLGNGRGKLRVDSIPTFLAGRDDPAQLQRLKELYGADLWSEIGIGDLAPLPGTREFLRTMRGGPLVVLSDSGPEVTAAAMQRYMHIGRPQVLTRDQHEGLQGTPHPDRLLAVAEEFGVAPEKCLVITASTSGATAGQRAGMQVIALRTLRSRWPVVSNLTVVDSLASLGATCSKTGVVVTLAAHQVERHENILLQ